MKVSIPGPGGNPGECVLCGGSFMKEILLGTTVPTIRIDGINCDLPIHREKCLPALQGNGPDWKSLPDGPLRQEFASKFGEQEVANVAS